MCQTGLNIADYKLAVHQLAEYSRLLKSNADQWARLAESAHEHDLSNKLQEAGAKAAEVTALFESAMEELRYHSHVHISDA
ncbi:MAG: hypothetical protein IBX64_02740 [Actinobacteria bacterium]|nr:hypothetical protein [Actinomycetota bacterium]